MVDVHWDTLLTRPYNISSHYGPLVKADISQNTLDDIDQWYGIVPG